MIPHSPPEEKKCSSSSVEVEEKGGRVEDVPLGVDPLSVGERVEDTSRGEGEGGGSEKGKDARTDEWRSRVDNDAC